MQQWQKRSTFQGWLQHIFALIILVFLLTGCAAREQSPPPLIHSQPLHKKSCTGVFPQGKWQFVHSIDFAEGGGNTTTVIGVTTLAENTLHSALLTVEGLTLFAADFFPDGGIDVQRAVPPFDNPNFARGMMRDIRTIFRPPDGTPQRGQTAEGETVCRYSGDKGMVTDILRDIDDNNNDCWRITRYAPEAVMDVVITGKYCTPQGNFLIPKHLRLQAFGMTDYTLKMKLISADKL